MLPIKTCITASEWALATSCCKETGEKVPCEWFVRRKKFLLIAVFIAIPFCYNIFVYTVCLNTRP